MRLTIFEPDPTAGGGFLVIEDDGIFTTIRLRRHELEILKALSDALEQDNHLPPEVRGWRRIGHITGVIGGVRGYQCEKGTTSRYLHRIRTSIRKATGRRAISWLQENRSFGLRLTLPIDTTLLSP